MMYILTIRRRVEYTHVCQESALCQNAMELATDFSGLGTAEIALQMLGYATLRIGLPFSWGVTSMRDHDPRCQSELRRRSDTACIFCDVLERIMGAKPRSSTPEEKWQELRCLPLAGHVLVSIFKTLLFSHDSAPSTIQQTNHETPTA